VPIAKVQCGHSTYLLPTEHLLASPWWLIIRIEVEDTREDSESEAAERKSARGRSDAKVGSGWGELPCRVYYLSIAKEAAVCTVPVTSECLSQGSKVVLAEGG
jgi:hypothetical protein